MPTDATLIDEFVSAGDASCAEARTFADSVCRIEHALQELQRLANLLAVQDGYQPVQREFSLPVGFKLSIVIPVYNEEATIQQVLAEVIALPIPKEVIVVDDASTDG